MTDWHTCLRERVCALSSTEMPPSARRRIGPSPLGREVLGDIGAGRALAAVVVSIAALGSVVAACAVGGEIVIDAADAGVAVRGDAGEGGTGSLDASGGTDDASSGGDGESDGAGSVACATTNTCAAARDIGTVSGDTSPGTGGNSSPAHGTTSEWLTVRVTEDDNSLGGHALGLKVTLASPPSANFDLFLYVDTGGSTTSRACSTVTKSSTHPAGQVDEATVSWGEGSVGNGSDDTRVVTIEIRHIAGTCSADAEWNLIAAGNP